MRCPICNSRLVMTGLAVWVTSGNPEVAPSLRHTYNCTNPSCESSQNDITWTYNGDVFIMHHVEAHQEEAA